MTSQTNFLGQARKELQANFPQLVIKDINFAGEGMDSQALLVNDDLIFRSPKREEVVGQLKAEIRLLPKLRPLVPFEIPNFEYIGRQWKSGLPFVGYKKILGVGLEKELLMGLDSTLRDNLIKEIADFIQQVHSFPVNIAQDCGVKVADFKKNYASDLESMRKDAYHFLDREAINYVEELHRDYLSDEKNFEYTPVLLHADFSPDHIIYDAGKNVIAGVIDFGDVEIGDPDYGLMYLYEDYWGKEFIYELLKYYPHRDTERLMRKLEFFSRCNTIHDVLMGIHRKDDGILQEALEELRKAT